MNTAILGAGSWGTALALVLARGGHPVQLWTRNPDFAKVLARDRENFTYLPGIQLPELIQPTARLEECREADCVLFVSPSLALRHLAEQFARIGLAERSVLISCTKGIELDTGLRMTQLIAQHFPTNPVAVLSGPSHAEEVAGQRPTAVVLGATDHLIAVELQKVIAGPAFRTYTSDDVAGIELGGALKNIFAIAAGISDGLGLGDNSKAALITRALAELIRLGAALGGRRETFQGLSGIGDLMVTCFSQHSRNRRVGERIAHGETLSNIAESMQMIAEGVPTARSAWQCALQLGIDAPITGVVHAILYENLAPAEGMRRLLARDLRPEMDR